MPRLCRAMLVCWTVRLAVRAEGRDPKDENLGHTKTARHRSAGSTRIAQEKACSKAQVQRSIAKMPTGTIEFKCIRINLKKTSTFESDANQVDSLVEFNLKIGGQRLMHLSAEVRQRNGMDFRSQSVEVGNDIDTTGRERLDAFERLPFREAFSNVSVEPRSSLVPLFSGLGEEFRDDCRYRLRNPLQPLAEQRRRPRDLAVDPPPSDRPR